MSLPGAVSRSIGCHTCRTAILRSFNSTTLCHKPDILRASFSSSHTSPSKVSIRAFTSTGDLRADKHNPLTVDPAFAFLDGTDNPPSASNQTLTASASSETTAKSPEHPIPAASSQTEPIPWYLQNRPAPTPQQPAIIPDLPHNPPPLLQTLLEYVAVTAGLDDLLLLDLRHLDPPPALGPKLIMIIATARSEKHLHVSADRFCRYLRREHRLRANAAGLLGRNELKIKLRRKAKRMKMLANVGGQEPEGNLDDGIRTGWICCTIGKIEAHPEDTEMPGDNVQEFVGFRDVKPGVNVVVQMFTEEKRAEVDLETLWGGVLKTHQRKDKNAEDALKELVEHVNKFEIQNGEEETQSEACREASKNTKKTLLRNDLSIHASNSSTSPVQNFHRPRATLGDVFPPASTPNTARQLRRLHAVGLSS